MNRVEIDDNEIELVFENCECIKVSLAALESLRMTTRGERIVYEKRFGALFTSIEVDTIELKLKLKDKLDFRHGSTGQIISFGTTESIFNDGEKCMERIRTCNDITHVYINGKCYQMPWDVEHGHPYTNLLQTTIKECTDGKEFITIMIKAKEPLMSCKSAKFPISDEKMLELLKKYPFLKMRNFWKQEPDDTFKTDAENIEHNMYKIWDGSGWEDLWKNRYLPRLFKEYDSWDEDTKSKFFFTDVKEKFGEMRIYTTFSSDKNLEKIAEWLSSCTCQYCGAEPRTPDGKRMSYQSCGWITNMCRNCAIEHELKPEGVAEENYEAELENMKTVCDQFGFKRYGNTITITTFKETNDGWLEVDKVEELDKEEERRQFIASLKGE